MSNIIGHLLSLAEKAVRVISLRTVVMWVAAALITIVGLTLFEHRDNILRVIVDTPSKPVFDMALHTPSSTIKRRVQYLVEREEIIIGITLVAVDIRNNARVPIYWYSADLYVNKQLDNIFKARPNGMPLFTSDDKNNTIVVSTINAEFMCGTYRETGAHLKFPNFENSFQYICHTSIPPFFGQFSGYLTFMLARQPNQMELDILKAESVMLSNEIYTREILPYLAK